MTGSGGRRRKRPIPEIPFTRLERQWDLVHFGSSRAVGREGDGFYIRVLVGEEWHGDALRSKFDYFRLDADGTVRVAPRGYAKDYKPGRIAGMDEALVRYAGGAS